ncbi:MAG: PAS domain S-box protein [Chitinophagales bacterium]
MASVVEYSDRAIICRDMDGFITSWNPSAERIFGYSAEEAEGKHMSLIMPEECVEEEENYIQRIKKGKAVFKYESIRKRKDGSRIFTSHIIAPVKNAEDKIIGTSKIVGDISDEHAVYAAIVNTSDDAICSKTLDGFITTWNFGAEKMFGYKKTEVLGKHINLIVPDAKIKEEISIRQKIRAGKRIPPFETVRVRKDGSKVNISLTVSPIYNQSGKLTGASIIAKDINERKQIEAQQILYTEKLEELNRYRDDFIAMASHELKTPLTVIKLNLQILEETMRRDENLSFVKSSGKQINKLTSLIAHLLDVSRIQAGEVKLDYQTFDFKILLKEVAENLQSSNTANRIQLKGIKKDLTLFADRERIEHLMTNLVSNALKYSPDSGKIVIKSSIENGQLQVMVKDEGIGLPEKELEKIFERFYRVNGIPSTYSGSGVGLFICWEIVRWHGGKIWAESELGKWSKFYFNIPVGQPG